MAFVTSVRLLFTSTISAESIAISVPLPIAMPMSALVNAGASFIPSPTIATFSSCEISLTTFSLSSGRSSKNTSSTPTFFPIYFAVFSLSPVSITAFIPISCNSLIAFMLSSLKLSASPIAPMTLSSIAKNIGVLPSSASFSALLNISSGILAFSSINPLLPAIILFLQDLSIHTLSINALSPLSLLSSE